MKGYGLFLVEYGLQENDGWSLDRAGTERESNAGGEVIYLAHSVMRSEKLRWSIGTRVCFDMAFEKNDFFWCQ